MWVEDNEQKKSIRRKGLVFNRIGSLGGQIM